LAVHGILPHIKERELLLPMHVRIVENQSYLYYILDPTSLVLTVCLHE